MIFRENFLIFLLALSLVNYNGPLISDVIVVDVPDGSTEKEKTAKADSKEKTAKADSKEKTAKADSKEKKAKADSKEKTAKADSKEKTAKADSKEKSAKTDLKEKSAKTDSQKSTGTGSAKDHCEVYIYKDEPWYEHDDLSEFLWETVFKLSAMEIDIENKDGLVLCFMMSVLI